MPCQRPHVDASLLCWQRDVALLPRSCQCFSNLVVVWCQSNSFLVFQALSLYHWWDWPLTWLTNHRSSVLWHFWLGHLTRKIVSEMTYNVSSWMLNPTIPYHSLSLSHRFLLWLQPWSLSTTMLLWHSFLKIIIIIGVWISVYSTRITTYISDCASRHNLKLNQTKSWEMVTESYSFRLIESR